MSGEKGAYPLVAGIVYKSFPPPPLDGPSQPDQLRLNTFARTRFNEYRFLSFKSFENNCLTMATSSKSRPRRVLPARAVRSAYQRERGPASRTPLIFEFDQANETDTKGEGEECELRAYDFRTDVNGELIKLRSALRKDFLAEKDPAFRSALVLTRTYSFTNELESTELEIKSPYIQDALRTVIKSYPGTSISTESTGRIVILDEPQCIFHFRNELQAYADASGSPLIESHMDLCMRYMRQSLRKQIASYDVTMTSPQPGLECHLLWMAFKPGQLLYQNIEGVEVLSRLRSIFMDRRELASNPQPLRYRPWVVEAETLKSDGMFVGFVPHIVLIHSYEGCQPLISLPICPLDVHPEKPRIAEEALLRGRQYLSLLRIHHRYYDGLAKFCILGPTNNVNGQKNSEVSAKLP